MVAICGVTSIATGGLSAAQASGVFMSEEWAGQICQQWNQSEALTTGLAGDTWVANMTDKGYKVIQLYRDECGPETRVELHIKPQDGKAICTYGGPVKAKSISEDSDYVMHATDEHWQCMGEGRFGCGAMGSMMSGELKFEGPKMEAASVIDPFNAFLELTGGVGGSMQCPSTKVAAGH
ncbi:MAG: SCP2 sterol-binding domain-containing protein [Halothiobacillaceae bacterium]|nr:SCP2 sterol-binding domain-containing protein [Halothiobacillaceae bacterium]